MRQRIALLGRAAAEQERAHGGGLADADGGDGGGDVGHGVVNGEAGGDGAARAVDVEAYGLFGGVGFEEEELGDNGGGDGFVNGTVEADDTFLGREGGGVSLGGRGVLEKGMGTFSRRENMSSWVLSAGF